MDDGTFWQHLAALLQPHWIAAALIVAAPRLHAALVRGSDPGPAATEDDTDAEAAPVQP